MPYSHADLLEAFATCLASDVFVCHCWRGDAIAHSTFLSSAKKLCVLPLYGRLQAKFAMQYWDKVGGNSVFRTERHQKLHEHAVEDLAERVRP